MDKDLKEMKDRLRQAEQNFNYADDDYIDAAIMEMNTVNEKFRAMLREKKKERRERDAQLCMHQLRSIPRPGREVRMSRKAAK